MHLLNYLIQARDFLTQHLWNRVHQRLINHFTARRFTDAGISGVIGEHDDIAGKVCVMRPANIE